MPNVRRLALLAVLLGSVSALATPQPLPFSYVYDTLPKGGFEVEQYVDLEPLHGVNASSGALTPLLSTQLQTELEYGLTDHLELALYVTVVPTPGATFSPGYLPTLVEGNGSKQRIHYRFAEAGEWPVDLGLYFEVTENEREVELEGKVLLQRRFGNLRAVANLWAEREFYYAGTGETVINPTLGLTYEVKPWLHPGIEGWMHMEFPDGVSNTSAFNLGPHIYAGPTVMLNFGKLWWSTGAYIRTTDWDHAPPSPTSGQPPDAFSKVWIRTVFGVEL